jgi:hypothetical protein
MLTTWIYIKGIAIDKALVTEKKKLNKKKKKRRRNQGISDLTTDKVVIRLNLL